MLASWRECQWTGLLSGLDVCGTGVFVALLVNKLTLVKTAKKRFSGFNTSEMQIDNMTITFLRSQHSRLHDSVDRSS